MDVEQKNKELPTWLADRLPNRLPELDSVRGIAALWVFTYHVWQFADTPTLELPIKNWSCDLLQVVKHGPAGVDMFMVLSGFCLFWPLAQAAPSAERWDWKNYARRRVMRIVPAYYGAIVYAVLLPVVLVVFVRQFGWEVHSQPVPSWWQVLSHLMFVHTFFIDTWNGITGAFWSMGLEAQFYATFPILVWAWHRIGVWAIAWTAVASILFRLASGAFMGDGDPLKCFLLSITFLGRWIQFSAGMAAALYVAQLIKTRSTVSGWTHLALMFTGVCCVLLAVSDTVSLEASMPWRDLLLAVGYASLLASLCTASGTAKFVFLRGPLPWLGRISYSFFLIHQPTAWYAMELFRKKWGVTGVNQLWLGYTVGLAVTLLCAWSFYLIFERPFLFKRSKSKDERTVRVPLSTARGENL